MPKGAVLVLAVLAAAIAVTHAVNFPYVQCKKNPTAYSLAPLARTPDPSTFCFTIQVAIPDDCDDYCCNTADLRKILIDINPECNVKNARLDATINGVPTKVGPGFEPGVNGPEDAYVLRLTQLGLNLTNADNAEVCITLGANTDGEGCVTMQALCKPPAGAPAGTCSAALFDVQNDCCPITPITAYVAPPPPQPLVPYDKPCTVCATLKLEQVVDTWFQSSFTQAQCSAWQSTVVTDMTAQAAAVGAAMVDVPPVVTCTNNTLQVCFQFATDEDGAKMQDIITSSLNFWNQEIANPCKAYYRSGYSVLAQASNGVDDTGCVNAFSAVACDPAPAVYPKCKCITAAGATPFFANPYLELAPGRTNTTTQYCFSILVRTPNRPESACGQTTTLLKAEVFADEAQRRMLKALYVQRAGALSQRWIAHSWGAKGDNTLKFTPLNWSLKDADGAKLCMEMDSSYPIGFFCFSGLAAGTCRINFFDDSRNCCPVFDAST